MLAVILRSFPGIPSGPHALLGSKPSRALKTSFSVNWMLDKAVSEDNGRLDVVVVA
jgi:hypothetical protein